MKAEFEWPETIKDYNSVVRNQWKSAKFAHPRSRKKAIRSMCLLCCSTSKEVEKCGEKVCPLHQFRMAG